MKLTPACHPNLAVYLSNLGGTLLDRFEQTGDGGDLEGAALSSLRDASHAPSASPAVRQAAARAWGSLRYSAGERAANLLERAHSTGEYEPADEAIGLLTQLIASSREGDPGRPGDLSNLGSALRLQFERTGNLDDLNEAIKIGRQALTELPEHDPNRLGFVYNLCNALLSRFQVMAAASDFDDSVKAAREGVASAPGNLLDQVGLMNKLVGALLRAASASEPPPDLSQLIDLVKNIATVVPSNSEGGGNLFSKLGLAFQMQFQATKERKYLDEEITLLQKALIDAKKRFRKRRTTSPAIGCFAGT